MESWRVTINPSENASFRSKRDVLWCLAFRALRLNITDISGQVHGSRPDDPLKVTRESPVAMNTTIRPDYHQLTRRDIVPLVPRMGGTLLDVGGGVGATAALLKQTGLVERAGVVDLVAQDPVEHGLDFHYSADLESPEALSKLANEQGPFSTILCLDVLEHLVDPWNVVQRLHGMLEPDGVIIASIPNIRYFKASIPLLIQGRWDLKDSGVLDRTHLRWFVRKTAIELMTSSGLRLEEVVGKPGGGSRIKLARHLTLGIFNDLTNLQYLIRVRNTGAPAERHQ